MRRIARLWLRDGGVGFSGCGWLNEPASWRVEAGRLHVATDAGTDFWRRTHYGFERDSGHFFHCGTGAGFTAQVRVQARFEALYDQAGIMVRVDAGHWVKAGIEVSDGRAMLGSVLTAGQSDWATGAYGGDPGDFWMRATVGGGVLRLQVSADGVTWPLLRLAPFPEAATYLVGPMCCTPERAGLEVVFSDFEAGPARGKDLHDLS